jgi:hypothetical protein
MTAFRILVTGSRDLTDKEIVWGALSGVLETFIESMGPDEWDITLIHGGAAGADTLAAEWAAEHAVKTERYNPQWGLYGKAAGPLRNQQMVNTGADICVGFLAKGSRGTADCLKRAEKAGIPTVVFNL